MKLIGKYNRPNDVVLAELLEYARINFLNVNIVNVPKETPMTLTPDGKFRPWQEGDIKSEFATSYDQDFVTVSEFGSLDSLMPINPTNLLMPAYTKESNESDGISKSRA